MTLRLVSGDEAREPPAVLPKHWAAASAVMAACPEVWLGLPLDKLAEKREQLARMLAEVLP